MNISNGAFARAGSQIFTLVDTRTWYVVANFRETQLRRIASGAPTELYLLSQPGKHYRGTVVGLGWAMAPENGKVDNGLPSVDRSLDWIELAARFPGTHQGRESGRLFSHRRLGGSDSARDLAQPAANESQLTIDSLRRELTPTAGRGSATFRLALARMAATIPILHHHIPEAVLVMMVMYMVAREDTAATIMGSIMSAAGVTIGLALALFAWEISLDIPWLRLCFLIAFIFGGQYLQRVLRIGALGAAIGIPAAMVTIFPDTFPPNPEIMVEMVLWIWWCVVLGLAINAGVQILLSPGDPVTLLRRAIDTRLRAVEQALRSLAGNATIEPPAASLNALAIEGMSRPLSLLKSATIFQPWARERREKLAAIITLTDRLVTAAVSLEALEPFSSEAMSRERLLIEQTVASGRGWHSRRCGFRRPVSGRNWPRAKRRTRCLRWPTWRARWTRSRLPCRMAGFLRLKTLRSPRKSRASLPDAFTNPDYFHFAIKSSLAALICYVCFIGFNYPGISTSLLTCLVVSLSTIGASNQKGILRFGGAIVGGSMGMFALVYLFPECGDLWRLFQATGVAK